MKQAREWENNKDYARAVDCYLKVTQTVTQDNSVLLKCWHKVSITVTYSQESGFSLKLPS